MEEPESGRLLGLPKTTELAGARSLQGHEELAWNACHLCHYCLCSLHFLTPACFIISFSVAFWAGYLCQTPLSFLPHKLPVAALKPTLGSVDSNHKNLSFINIKPCLWFSFWGCFFLMMGCLESLRSAGRDAIRRMTKLEGIFILR